MASLTALGAGAVALTPESAEASVIYSGPFDYKVGIEPGDHSSYLSPILPGGAQFQFSLYKITSTYNHIVYHVLSLYVKGMGGVLGPFFEKTQTNPPFPGSAMKVVDAGAVWSSQSPLKSPLIAYRLWFGPLAYVYGLKSFTDKYALFKFNGCAAGTCYGWIELSLSVTDKPGTGKNGAYGPNLDILGFAYDDSGTLIPAGYKGPLSIPEPATFELTGLAALALGAVGLRSWRAARKS